MPIPSPSKGETQDNFMHRCMGSEVMKKEFPAQDQRVAVCMSKWRRKGKKETAESHNEAVETLIAAFLARHPELVQEERNGD